MTHYSEKMLKYNSKEKIMDNILKKEAEINILYQTLKDLEVKKENNNPSFDIFLNALNNNIIDEERLLSKLSIKELEEYQDKSPRLRSKIIDIICLRTVPDKKYIFLTNIFYSENADIYLSFIDENINSNEQVREKLINSKYHYIKLLSTFKEKELIKRKMTTPKSLYLSSLMYSQMKNINIEEYTSLKDLFASSQIKISLDKLVSNPSEYIDRMDNQVVFSSIIRSSLLMLNEKIDKKYGLINLLIDIYNQNKLFHQIMGNNFTEDIKMDKERHKILSLRPY